MFVLAAKPLYVLRFRARGRNSATAQRHALEREKKNGYTVAGDGENLHVLESFAVGNKGKAVLFFLLSRVASIAKRLHASHLSICKSAHAA